MTAIPHERPVPPVYARSRKLKSSRALRQAGPMTYVMLVLVLILSAFPLYFTFLVSTRTAADVFAARAWPVLTPGGEFMTNISDVWNLEAVYFRKALWNSTIVSSVVTLSVLFFSSLAGFAFAKLRFRGRNGLMGVLIGTMMIPAQLGIIPLFVIMVRLGWNGHLQSVIVPLLVSAFGVFFMRQYMVEAIPDELIEAARVDGCSMFRIYWHVVLPAIRPAAAVLGLLTFMQTWNDFLWPIVALRSDNPTVQVALNTLAAGYYVDYRLVLTGAFLAILPLVIVFFLFGRQIVGGIMEGAVKG